jgi:hypothetical protein
MKRAVEREQLVPLLAQVLEGRQLGVGYERHGPKKLAFEER